MTRDSSQSEAFSSMDTGTLVYDEENDLVGVVREFTDDGAVVVPPEAGGESGGDPAEPVDAGPSDSDEQPGQKFGEGYIMWKCDECGEMGELDDGMPEECPNCGAEKESIYRFRED